MSKRATGRTRRMMLAAIEAAQQGRAVYVVCATQDHARALEQEYDHFNGLGIKYETFGSLSNLDPITLKLKGAWPNCRVFIDHFAIEAKFAAVLAELTKYDECPHDR